MEEKTTETVKKGNVKALLPIGVFLVLYLGLGILFEYGMGIPMGFYNIPVVVIFLVALLVACFQNRKLPFDDKLTIMGRGMGDKTIVTMVLIFMVAGIFVGTVGRDSAESVAYLLLSVVPVQFAVAVLFVVSCFVSLSMGTSVGTITLITPIAVAVSSASGFSLPLCVASVMGGAMFGDNLSFISDTTIAACQGQGCQMKDKFRENFKIALPAAIVSLVIILALSFGADLGGSVVHEYDLIQLIPYLIVLVGGIIGVNVFVVLLLGILSGSIIMVATGATAATDLLANMGSGAAGMFETTMVALLVSAICALIREYGGFVALLNGIKSLFKRACWWVPWTSPPRTTPWPSSSRTPSPPIWRRRTASRSARRHRFWTRSRAFSKASCPTAPRCSWPSRPPRSLASRCRRSRSSRFCSTRSCC